MVSLERAHVQKISARFPLFRDCRDNIDNVVQICNLKLSLERIPVMKKTYKTIAGMNGTAIYPAQIP